MTDQLPPPLSADDTAGQRPPLVRPRQGRVVTGVCAGLSRHLNVDVAIVRIGTVLLAVLTQGVGLVAYIAASLIIPSDGESAERDEARSRDGNFWAGVALLIVGAVWLMGGPLSGTWFLSGLLTSDVLVALILIGFGLALWRSSERKDITMNESNDTTGGQDDASRPAWQPLSASADSAHPTAPPASTAWMPPPAQPQTSSILGRATMGVALVVVGVLWLLRISGALAVGVTQLLAAALLVIGIGLIIGSVIGRARWLILVGSILLPFVLIAAFLRPIATAIPSLEFTEDFNVQITDGGGDVREAPSGGIDQLEDTYRFGGGRYVLDLRDVTVDEAARTSVEMGAGELIVYLPDDVTAHVTARVGVGEVRLAGTSSGGLGVDRTATIVTGDGNNEFRLDINLGVGSIQIND
ncbi:MAG: PspC domain-containing protein [Nitriliruptoraceae bacterium]